VSAIVDQRFPENEHKYFAALQPHGRQPRLARKHSRQPEVITMSANQGNFLFNLFNPDVVKTVRDDAEQHLKQLFSDNCEAMYLYQRDAMVKFCKLARKNPVFAEGDSSPSQIFLKLFEPLADIVAAYCGAFPNDATQHGGVFKQKVCDRALLIFFRGNAET
jgi:hypothetical protein